MKKILPLIAIIALVAVIFTFAACGGKTGNDIKDEMTTLKDGATSMMDDMSSALGELGDDLTENGNVTDQDSSTGLFEDMTSGEAPTSADASQTTTESTSTQTN